MLPKLPPFGGIGIETQDQLIRRMIEPGEIEGARVDTARQDVEVAEVDSVQGFRRVAGDGEHACSHRKFAAVLLLQHSMEDVTAGREFAVIEIETKPDVAVGEPGHG